MKTSTFTARRPTIESFKLLLLILIGIGSFMPAQAQLAPNGTGTVGGYYIGPGVNLQYAFFDHADLSGPNLTGADLTSTLFNYCNLTSATLTGTRVGTTT